MASRFQCGWESPLEFDLPDDRLLAWCGAPASSPVRDAHEAALAALSNPLDFPPLGDAVVPGDRVALAIGRDVPRVEAVVAALFDVLSSRGVSAEDITLLSAADRDIDPRDLLPAPYRDAAQAILHDPDARADMSYLAVGRDDKPIYLHRALCDADVVVPVGCLRCEPALDYVAPFGGLFPTFSTRQAQHDMSDRRAGGDSAAEHARGEEAGWLLGVSMAVAVVPGPGATVLEVLAGKPSTVVARGQAACQNAWTFRTPREAQLVVAIVDGPQREQTWENLARAMATARRVVAGNGAIALVTSLDVPPGPSLRACGVAEDPHQALRHIRRAHRDDALPAAELALAQSDARVYLLSRLDDATVEELGVTPLANAAELSRLAARCETCIVISNAQYAIAWPGND